MTEEAKALLGIDDQALFRRAYRWYWNNANCTDTAADNIYKKFQSTKEYPPFVLDFSQTVVRTRKKAALAHVAVHQTAQTSS